jgi:hypothetical protein
MARKIVNNSDPGGATQHGGDSTDYINRYLTGEDQSATDPVDINTTTTFRTSKRKLRNPANTFSYTEAASAITADRTVTEPLLTGNDTRVYQAHPATLTSKTIDVTTNTLKNLSSIAYFFIYQDAGDSLYKCINTKTGGVVSSNSDPTVVIQFAIDNLTSTAKSIFIKAGTYLLTAGINCVDKGFLLMGERAVTGGGGGSAGDTILRANYTDAVGAVFNCHNTIYVKQQFKNIVIEGSGTVKYVIDLFDARQNWPIFENVGLFDASDTNLLMEKVQQSSCINLSLRDASTQNLLLKGTTGTDKINTLHFYGGQIGYSGCNVRTSGSLTDVSFNGVLMEANNDTIAFTNLVDIASNSVHGLRFRDCGFEYAGAAAKTVVTDSGNNNTFDNCRFNADNTTYTPIQYTSTATNGKFINNIIHANTASTTAIIQIDAGATGIRLIDNLQATNTPIIVNLKDLGTGTIRLGNSFCADSYIRSANSGLTGRRTGRWLLGNSQVKEGMCVGWSDATTTPAAGTFVAADMQRPMRWTSLATIGDNVGMKSFSAFTCRLWNPRMTVRFRINDTTNTRLYIGMSSAVADPSGDDPLNALSGALFGKVSTDASWAFMHNDGSGVTVVDDSGIAADTNIHKIEVMGNSSGSFTWQLDEGAINTVTTEIPASATQLQPFVEIETVDANAKTFDLYWVDVETS